MTLDTATLDTLGHAATMLTYEQFLTALRCEDDSYARDKYRDLRNLARAMSRFSNGTLQEIARVYVESR